MNTGFTGKVIINQNSTRTPLFVVYNLDSTDKEMIVMQITEDLDDSKDPVASSVNYYVTLCWFTENFGLPKGVV